MRRALALLVSLALAGGMATTTAASAEPGPSAGIEAGEATEAAEAALTGVASVAAGYYNSCAVLTNGQVRCWGRNDSRQVGNDSAADQFNRAQTVLDSDGTGPLEGVTQVVVGDAHACALLTIGEVRCWGENGFGALGNNDLPEDSALPVTVRNAEDTGPLTDVTELAAESRGTCALLENGQVRCWGQDNFGQLGDGGTNTDSGIPVAVSGVDTDVLADVASLGGGHRTHCAVLENGEARCWGRNDTGGLGDGTTDASSRPVVVRGVGGTGSLTGVTQITSSEFHTCARRSSGRVVCWGFNQYGQVGDGTRVRRAFPVPVTRNGVPLSGVRQVEVGETHSCALLTNGRLRCWGQDSFGQLGDGRLGSPGRQVTPTAVRNVADTGPLRGITQFDGGLLHNCARNESGQARCWGYGEYGTLGDGDTDNDVLPRPVLL